MNNFQIATDHPPGIAEGYTSGVAYNRVAYKKTRNFCYLCSNKNFYIFAMSRLILSELINFYPPVMGNRI